jgi:hypothetical protein
MTPYDLGYSFGWLVAQYVNLMLTGCLFSPVIVAVTLGALWLKKRGT